MNHNRNKMQKAGGVALLLLLIGAALLSLRYGSAALSGSAFWKGLTGEDPTAAIILRHLRLPRILGALLAGAGLALAGLLLQTVTGNELAGPNVIGVNAGAGLAVVIALFFAPTLFAWLPLSAFAGAFLTTLLIVAVALRVGGGRSAVLLTGIAVTALLQAGISLITLLDPDILIGYNHFSIGSVAGVRLEELPLPALLIGLCFGLTLLLGKRMETLLLGDSLAASLGIRVRPLRILCLLLASASAAAAVSFAGLLGFVGLMVPHMARRMAQGFRARALFSVLLGGLLVVTADLLGRVLIAPSELPVGILLAAIGAPFFFFLLLKKEVRS